MITRRELVKEGLGLAGIIAAGKAPASIVRALVGGRIIEDSKQELPYDAEVEWIQPSQKGIYIDTGFSPATTYGDLYDIEAVVSPYQLSYGLFTFGQTWHSSTLSFRVDDAYPPNACIYWSPNTKGIPVTRDIVGNWLHLSKVGLTTTMTNITTGKTDIVTTARYTIATSKPILLFGVENYYSQDRISSLRITSTIDGSRLLDIIAVRVGEEGYAYDKVSRRLLGGNGLVLVGPDKA